MNDRERDEPVRAEGRRSFLRRSGAALFGVGLGVRGTGRGQTDGQTDEGLRNVQFVLPNVPPLRPEFLRDVILLTESTKERLDVAEVEECGVEAPSNRLNGYEGLVIDMAATAQVLEAGDLSKLGQMTSTEVFVSPDAEDVRIGSPYIITDGDYCEEDYVAVTAHRLPHPLEGGTAPEGRDFF